MSTRRRTLYIPPKEPYIPPKEPYIQPKEPCIPRPFKDFLRGQTRNFKQHRCVVQEDTQDLQMALSFFNELEGCRQLLKKTKNHHYVAARPTLSLRGIHIHKHTHTFTRHTRAASKLQEAIHTHTHTQTHTHTHTHTHTQTHTHTHTHRNSKQPGPGQGLLASWRAA